MNRRDALKTMAVTAGGLILPGAAKRTRTPLFGWVFDHESRKQFIKRHKFPFLSQQAHRIKGTSVGRIVMLNPFMVKAIGHPMVPHDQGIGDCVSHSFALGVDILTSTQIFMSGKPEKWVAECATEPLYGGSRVEIYGGVTFGDGCMGNWAADWLIQYGALLRLKYPGGFDFTTYNPVLAKEYGDEGCPDSLEPLAKLHPVKTISLVNTFEEACDAIANGYPVTLSSDIGFGMTSDYWIRDSQGFLRRRGRWGHSMLALGFDRKSSRPGICIDNSWGNWISGPTQHGQPAGSFWCDASTVQAMLRQGDSYALSGYVGYPRMDIPDYEIW